MQNYTEIPNKHSVLPLNYCQTLFNSSGVNDYFEVSDTINMPFAYVYQNKQGVFLVVESEKNQPLNCKFVKMVYSEQELALFLANKIFVKISN